MVRTVIRRGAALVAATLMVGAATVAATSSPALAAEACEPNNKTITLPNKPDIDFYIEMCIYKDGNFRGGFARIYWDVHGGVTVGKRFDAFVLEVRTERYDTVLRTVTCDYTDEINNDGHGSSLCTTQGFTSTAQGGWTGDGKVTFNKDGDGEGNLVWQLTGSPRVN